MAFSIKEWFNLPAKTTKINAAALQDMEARLAAYTDALAATKGVANGIGSLDGTGHQPLSESPLSVVSGSVVYKALAGEPGLLVSGTITRSSTGAALEAPVVWPDGATGIYKGTESVTVPGAIDSYTITHVEGETTHTYTQAAVTRNTEGAVTKRPAITYV